MKNLFLICFFGLFSVVNATAQRNHETDSLRHELAVARHDTMRVRILTSLADRYRFSNQDSALFFVEKAVYLAKKIKFTYGQIWGIAVNGAILHDLGNLPKALELEFKALKIAEDSQVKLFQSAPIIFIGRIYFTLKDFPKALYYGRLENEIFEQANIEDSKVYAKENLARIFDQMNQLDSALYYLQIADKQRVKVKSVRQRVSSTYGNVYSKLGEYPLALSYYKKNLALTIKNNNHQNTARTFVEMARLFQKQNQADSSIYYAKKGLAEAQLVSHKQMIFENSTLLSALYEQKDTKEAFRYYKLATITKDSLFGAGNIQAMQLLVAQEEARQTEIIAERVAYHNQLKQYVMLAGLGIFLLIAFILYRNNRMKHKANMILEKTLSELKSTQAQLIQSEKLASLGELTAGIAHEIQNPLNFVNNFSEMSVELAKELNEEIDKEVIDKDLVKDLVSDLSQNQAKINHHGKRASSIVLGMLEHSRASTGERALTDINKLADEYLRLSYHGIRAKDNSFNSDYKTDFDENLPKIEVIPQDIGRVLLNLINNAFWAVKTVEKPLVTVTTEQSENQLIIKVSDNGTGMNEEVKAKIFQPFFTTKPTGQGTGLGLSLAYDIVTKGHGGTIEVESVEGEGATFVVKLPL